MPVRRLPRAASVPTRSLTTEGFFDGKHGERLIRRMTEGISMQAIGSPPIARALLRASLRWEPTSRSLAVENLDTYDEIVKLLRGRKHAKLFGIKVGGVIFGGGCKASVSHALDDYLAEIGYRFNYVYYVGDIDREGARIVEQARNANVVEIRLHAGMYRAMLAEHKRRVKAGGECSPRLPTRVCRRTWQRRSRICPWLRACSSATCCARAGAFRRRF